MNKTCEICHKQGKYKCPTCLIFYCSVPCCKKHRENNCQVGQSVESFEKDVEVHDVLKKRKFDTSASTVSEERLKCLKTDEDVNKLLTNNHLKNLLVAVDKSENADEIMQKAMQEPIFVEFADACLKVVDPDLEENT
ncbi:hypothetical protein JTB14_014466 [Gonioctena quinquepunctata]|nr:hypothetical protein JTB14_014466 [Gonioctena quinquepunctata]